MLRFHETSTYGPIDSALAEQWRSKASVAELSQVEAKLGPLLAQKAKLGPLLAQKGYVPSGAPQITLGPLARRLLWVRNKAATIRMSVDTYGLPLYL